jgi:Fur family ferric uptake transcriptional regulator
MAEYQTRQREQITKLLALHRGEHLTAKSIRALLAAEALRLQNAEAPEGAPAAAPKVIGTATIYRTLDKLIEAGQVRRYRIEGIGSACYEYIGGEGPEGGIYHCKCRLCGRLIHLECGEMEMLEQHVLREHAFRIDPLHTVRYGTCSECLRRRRHR